MAQNGNNKGKEYLHITLMVIESVLGIMYIIDLLS